jgi:Holliday junction resolvasome RuvABC endonuclease subunit
MHDPGGILSLDLSSRTGWAYGGEDDPYPLCGVWIMEGDTARILVGFENELEDALVFFKPRLIMAEAPLPPTALSNVNVWRQQLGLAAMAEAAAFRHDIRFAENAASTIRTEVLGTARFPKGQVKPAVLAYCDRRGWKVPDHNAADACIVWEYAHRHLYRARAPA